MPSNPLNRRPSTVARFLLLWSRRVVSPCPPGRRGGAGITSVLVNTPPPSAQRLVLTHRRVFRGGAPTAAAALAAPGAVARPPPTPTHAGSSHCRAGSVAVATHAGSSQLPRWVSCCCGSAAGSGGRGFFSVVAVVASLPPGPQHTPRQPTSCRAGGTGMEGKSPAACRRDGAFTAAETRAEGIS